MKYLSVVLVLVIFIAGVAAQDLSTSKGLSSVSIEPGQAVYSSPAGTIIMSTLIDDVKLSGVDKVDTGDGSKVMYRSSEKALYVLPAPVVEQVYEYRMDGSLEDTVTLKEPRKLSYQVKVPEGGYLALQPDGTVRIVNPSVDENTEGYNYIHPAVGTDANGQGITFGYEIIKDFLVVVVPKAGDDGKELAYPIIIDPTVSYGYGLKLLLHGNLEPTSFSTSDFRDSSRYFAMPYGNPNTSGAVDVNSSTAARIKYGNASMFIKGVTSNVTVPDSPEYNFLTNNHSISGWIYFPQAVGTTYIWQHIQDANNYDRLAILDSTTNSIGYQRARGGVAIGTQSSGAGSAIATGIWYHVAVIQNGTYAQLYLNGTPVGAGFARTGTQTDLNGPVNIGFGVETGGVATTYLGYRHLDEVIVTNGGIAPTIAELTGEWPLYLNGSAGGYADDDYTRSLLHFDGINDGTGNLTDRYANRSWTRSAPLVTATNASKFGATGAYFGQNGYITTPYSADFDMGTGDWTIDFYTSLDASTSLSRPIWAGTYPLAWGIQAAPTAVNLYSNTSGGWTVDAGAATTITPGTKYHIAVVRNGTSIRFFKDGVLLETDTIPAAYQYNSYRNTTAMTGYNCTMDEVRITKGLARWSTTFTPPTTPYELVTDVTFTATPDASGTAPVTVQFNVSDPSDAWTENYYNWSFGDGTYSVLKEPSHTFSTTGMFNVTFTAMNNNMTNVTRLDIPVGSPNVDFSATPLSGQAALTVVFTDLTTNTTPITSYLMDFGDGTTSTELPPWTHVYSTYGAFTPNLTETNSFGTGFESKRDYIVVSTQQSTTWYSPRITTFTIIDANGISMDGVSVDSRCDESTLPGGITGAQESLVNNYGMNSIAAAQAVNTALLQSGHTGDDGSITFTMVSSIRYNINVTDAGGVVYTTTLYPSATDYIIRTTNSTYTQPQNVVSNYNAESYSVLNITEPDVYNVTLQMFYYNSLGTTNYVNFWVEYEGNHTIIYWHNQTPANHMGPVLANKTLLNTRGEQWRWGYYDGL